MCRFSHATMPCSKRARASGELVVMSMRSEPAPVPGVWAAAAAVMAAGSNANKTQRWTCKWFFILLISTEDVAVLNRQFAVDLQHFDFMVDAKHINQPDCSRNGMYRVQHCFIGIDDDNVVMMLSDEIPQVLRVGLVDA